MPTYGSDRLGDTLGTHKKWTLGCALGMWYMYVFGRAVFIGGLGLLVQRPSLVAVSIRSSRILR